eukprot:2953521-Prymnesium_polylepis.1
MPGQIAPLPTSNLPRRARTRAGPTGPRVRGCSTVAVSAVVRGRLRATGGELTSADVRSTVVGGAAAGSDACCCGGG